jgi:hypothetical protein
MPPDRVCRKAATTQRLLRSEVRTIPWLQWLRTCSIVGTVFRKEESHVVQRGDWIWQHATDDK